MNSDAGKEIFTLTGPAGHTSSVFSVCISVDGTRVVTGSSDKTANIWDAATGDVLRTLQGHTNLVWSVCISVDGTRVVTGSQDNTAKIWMTDISSSCQLCLAFQTALLLKVISIKAHTSRSTQFLLSQFRRAVFGMLIEMSTEAVCYL